MQNIVRAFIYKFIQDTRGSIAIIAGMVFPILVGVMALGTEAGFWYLSQRKLQQTADLVAYSAVVQLRSGRSKTQMLAVAQDIADSNGFQDVDDTLKVNNPPTSGANTGNLKAVEVKIVRSQTRYFTMIYSSDPVEINARAVAEYTEGSNACLLALDPTAGGAVTVSGSSEVVFDGCDVATNSNDAQAFQMSGGSVQMSTGCVHSVGGVETTSGLTLTTCSSPKTEVPVVVDPYSDVADPEVVGECADGDLTDVSVATDTGHPLGMGSKHFCGGLSLHGTIDFAAGLYIVDGGVFKINASAEVSGTGVTFFLTNAASLSYNGGATINLSAPTSGALAGLLFYADRDDVGVSHTINGNSGSELNGAIYMPSGDLDYSGNFSGGGNGGCTQIVTRRVTFSGNSSLQVDCTAGGTRRIAVGESIALME
jgi:Flp pilus assembly protein TadG